VRVTADGTIVLRTEEILKLTKMSPGDLLQAEVALSEEDGTAVPINLRIMVDLEAT
jgi:hypothetical protein